MITRFTFFHTALYPTGIVVNQPYGWKDIVMSLRRDKKLWCLSEFFESNFFWYGTAHQVINEIADEYGAGASMRVLIEDYINGAFVTLFDGSGSIEDIEDIPKGDTFYKTAMPISKESFWVKFINRFETEVNVASTLDIDGGTRVAVPPINHPMPSQKLRTLFSSEMARFDDPDRNETLVQYDFDTSGSPNYDFGVIQFPVILRDTVETRRTYIPVSVPIDGLFENFTAKFRGTYTFDIQVVLSTSPYAIPFGLGDQFSFCALRIYKNNNLLAPLASGTLTNQGTNGVDGRTKLTLSYTLDLEVGENITYALDFTSGVHTAYVVYKGVFPDDESFIRVSADTLYEDTTVDGYLVKDVAEAIISKLVGVDNVVQSSLLDTEAGLLGMYKGKHVRELPIATYPIFMSLKDWHDCVDPVLCLGIGKVYGENKIEIEKREDFFRPIPSIVFDKVVTLTRKFDKELYHKTIKIGFDKIGTDVEEGFDDPQGSHTYRTSLPSFGEKTEILSKAIAGSAAIEQIRRAKVKTGDSHSADDDIILISLIEDGESYLPEFGTAFAAITNLINSNFRINNRMTPARLFKRFQSWLQGFMQFPSSDSAFIFSSGEGNILMTSQLNGTDYEAESNPDAILAENADISVTNDYTILPKLYEGKLAVTLEEYQTITTLPKNCIGVRKADGTYRLLHINEFKFHRYKGYAEISGWLFSDNVPISALRLLEDGYYRLLENGNYRLLES
jgi:hypothetical protein